MLLTQKKKQTPADVSIGNIPQTPPVDLAISNQQPPKSPSDSDYVPKYISDRIAVLINSAKQNMRPEEIELTRLGIIKYEDEAKLWQEAKKHHDLAFAAYRKTMGEMWEIGQYLNQIEARQHVGVGGMTGWQVILDEMSMSRTVCWRARALATDCPTKADAEQFASMYQYELAFGRRKVVNTEAKGSGTTAVNGSAEPARPPAAANTQAEAALQPDKPTPNTPAPPDPQLIASNIDSIPTPAICAVTPSTLATPIISGELPPKRSIRRLAEAALPAQETNRTDNTSDNHPIDLLEHAEAIIRAVSERTESPKWTWRMHAVEATHFIASIERYLDQIRDSLK
ncbi:MAG: hypothetical protein WCI73_00460 [Phycisphaerae bacterium]